MRASYLVVEAQLIFLNVGVGEVSWWEYSHGVELDIEASMNNHAINFLYLDFLLILLLFGSLAVRLYIFGIEHQLLMIEVSVGIINLSCSLYQQLQNLLRWHKLKSGRSSQAKVISTQVCESVLIDNSSLG
jgi:hypothetical protein